MEGTQQCLVRNRVHCLCHRSATGSHLLCELGKLGSREGKFPAKSTQLCMLKAA
jgi:hypothetical protein